mmetsp:Transcript_64909/g.107887  ORF Transcript_64909/g.107887 Transcript_64909/m.107887 type:complete len:154 (-) Transcript_64909:322-783(-)|eukprot:CAMPEP_0119346276 /NCGR_PEP_ID=MMETSP1333-20130426/107921_1 /TAXON_ID=418940 /ORGANISM="Scyphosphaera apsteinii, Strain RCC1455" /LENGTH=153 /DNA_ID=CAMNT_0007358775 /DNA_START=38 /DNA_END=499 /DNA_ORIENTATION=-
MAMQIERQVPKRGREGFDESAAAEPPSCSPHRMLIAHSPAGKRTRTHADPGAASSTANSPFVEAADHGMHASAVDLSSALRQRCDPHTGEVLFTLDQVKDIVRRAVEEKERSLRETYDRILQEKLQEQFRSFAKFNEDYISRQLKSGDLSYCS